MLSLTRRFVIEDPSAIGAARRAAQVLAAQIGFDESDANDLALIVNEAGSNLIKHAARGEILVRTVGGGNGTVKPARGIEMLALDRGVGIADTAKASLDGWSTAGSLGLGLGAIRRLSATSDLFSQRAKGTAVLARVFTPQSASESGEPVDDPLGVVCLPIQGEDQCGDGWSVTIQPARIRAFIVDGLGHGPEAAAAARVALETLDRCRDLPTSASMQRLHAAMRPTRGGAAAMVDIHCDRGVVTYCGVGNIAAVIARDSTERHLVSQNGTLGHNASRFQEFQYPWDRQSTLLMHSDGLKSRWTLEGYPGLLRHHPAITAGVLYRDFSRGTDDISILALREPSRK